MENKTYKPAVAAIETNTFWMEYGNHTRIELKNDSFGIGKIHVGLQKFGDDNKQIAYVNSYIDFDTALVIANDILTGRYARMAEKNGNDMTVVYKQPGGQPADRANRSDGKPMYRELTITKGKLWLVSVQEGPGKVSATGGFVPDGKYDVRVSVGLSNESLKAMALMIQNEYLAYRTAQFVKLR